MFDPAPPTKTEPVFNVPWPVLGLCGFILALYALQSSVPDEDLWVATFALNPVAFRAGAWDTIVTYMLLHGGWMHAGMNAVWALAFAAPVCRAFGVNAGGFISFVAFYIICGIVAGAGFVLLKSADFTRVIGASGAIAGLIGAAIRLRYRGILLPLKEKLVAGFSVVFIVLNVMTEFVSLLPGIEAGGIAWQTHVFGYLCGLFLIGPWIRLFHRNSITQI